MKIPMLDLVRQYRSIKTEIDEAVQEVLESGAYIMGPQVAAFEQEMASFLKVKHAIGLASGSDALLLGLHALGIGPGDKVIVPTFTFFATAGAVYRLGATPVFADIEPATYNLDMNRAEELLKADPSIKAVIPVHIFGQPCDMVQMLQLARQYDLKIVEDACQAINSEIGVGGELHCAGSLGDCGCFSFFPSKNLSCCGDGGMLATNDDYMADMVKILRVHGSRPKYYHRQVGYNSRLDTIQAAILRVKLRCLPEWTSKRQQVARSYNRLFAEWNLQGELATPQMTAGHVFHQYVIEIDNRDGLAEYLNRQGVSTAVYYPVPLHLQECFSGLGYRPGDCPEAEKACHRVLALPIDPELKESEIEFIVDSIAAFMNDK